MRKLHFKVCDKNLSWKYVWPYFKLWNNIKEGFLKVVVESLESTRYFCFQKIEKMILHYVRHKGLPYKIR